MIQVIVTNPNKSGSPFKASFPTTEEAQNWVNNCSSKSSKPWGEVGEFTVEITDISEQVAQQATNAEALKFLASTDWLIIREADSGESCPAEIKAERAAARARIIR